VISENEQGAVILALQRAAHATLRCLTARLADLDLTGSEVNALAILADGRARSAGALALDIGIRPTTLTSLLDRLVRRGYVIRELDPRDRRSFRISLTDAGRPAAQAALAAMSAAERSALAVVSSADLAGFRAVVHAITELS
jgi:DNA-binding MarR family transcriptional regulator